MVSKMYGMLIFMLLYRYLGGWGNLGEFEEHFLPLSSILESPHKSLDTQTSRDTEGGCKE